MPPRCFLSIELPDQVLRILGDARQALIGAQGAWAREKWVRPEHQHITLKFIGALPDDACREVLAALAPVLHDQPTLRLRVADVRAIPSPRRAQLLWALYEDETGDSQDLAAACDRIVVERFGVPPDTRRFQPHTTLARVRSPHRLSASARDAAREVIVGSKDSDRIVSVRSVTLISSTLNPGGPEYTLMGSVPLGR